ncbi:MAG: four helix bundle protein [Bacteroidetes bacterium]|nr:four helix bundle protein [Bacteroidota bacterium]
MKKSILKEKSFSFAIRVIKLYRHLVDRKKEFVLSKQLLRSGTSIGSNIREAFNGESTKDFIHKLSIAQKETDETIYWLELLKETGFITDKEFLSMNNDAVEVLKLIKSSIITSKSKLILHSS